MAEFSTDEKTQVPAGTEEVYEKFVETPQGIPAEPTLDVGPATEFLGKTPENLPFFQEVPDDEIPPGFMGLSEFNKIRRASKVKGPGSDAKMAMIWGMADQLGMKPHEVANHFEELSDEIMHRDRATAASLAMTAAIPFALAAPVAAPIIGGRIGAALATLGVKPISMIAGIAGFEMLPRIQNMLVKYFEDGKFQPSALGDKYALSRFVPGEASDEEKAMAELFDIVNASMGASLAGAGSKFARHSWAKLTKEILAEIRAPKEIFIDATVLKQVVAENPQEWPAFLREMKESFGLEAADINHAVQNGYAISVPTHLVTFLVDRPWWETLKRGIGLDPYKRMGGVYRETPLTQIEGPQGKLEGTQGAGVPPMEPLPRDRLIDTIAEAMKQVESGGDYSIVSRDGGKGAYQFTGTWPSWSAAYAAEKGLGNQPLPFTPENQDAVAKWKIGQYLDKGWTLEQVAAAWNGGEGVVPNDRWKTMVGKNDAGVRYDVPHHVSKVVDAFNKISGGAVVPSSPGARKPSTFTRGDLVESMERVQLPFEQKQGFLELLDAVAESWALTNKLTPDHFYEHLFAGLKVVEDSEALKDFVLKQTERDRLRNMEVQPGKTQAMVDSEQVRLMRETMRFAQPPDMPLNQAKSNVTENPAFREWFGSSKVVDDKNQPRIFYRGSPNPNAEPYSIAKETGFESLIYTSPSGKLADIYGQDVVSGIDGSIVAKGKTFPIYVKADKPFDTRTPEGWALWKQFQNDVKPISGLRRTVEGSLPDWVLENELRNWLDSNGIEYDGIWFAENSGDPSLAVKNMTQIKSIFNRGTFDPNNPNILKQAQDTIIKGAAQILDDLKGMIYLFEKAGTPNYDVSTLFEEFLHVYAFHMLPEDVAVVNQWHGIAEDTPVTEWTTDQHENFAKAWLKFLYEGVAPSSKLRALFAKIRKWMVDLYHFISKLDVELTEPLRDVFRKIIARAERENNGLFRVRDAYEFTPSAKQERTFFQVDTKDEYDKLMAEASRRALEKVHEKRQKTTERRENQWAKQAKQIAREDPLQALKEEIVKRGGMSHRELSQDYGAETLAALDKKRPGLVSKKGKLPPDVIVADYGFEGLDDMIQTILDGPTLAEAVETQVEFMRQENLAESESEALEDLLAIMDEEVKILSELTKSSTEKMTNIPAPDLKGIIRRNTGQVKVDEAKQVSEYHALKASLERQQRAARVAFNAGKVDGALKAKVQARATAQKLLEKRQANVLFKKLVRNIERMARDKKLPWDYAKQIQDILEPFGFKKRTEAQEAKWEKEIRGRLGQDPKDLETFDEFLRRLESEGELVNIDPKAKRLIDKMNRVPITDVSDVQIIHDAVEHLYHLGTTKGKLLSQKQKRDLDTVCAFIAQNILAKAPKVKELWEVVRPSGTEKTLSERIRDHIKEWDAELLPAEFLIRMMDGFEENGPFWNHTKLPVEEAFEIKSKLMKQIEQAFKKAFGNIPEKKLREWAKKKESFPRFPMHLQMMTKQQMIMLVANSFHPDNIKALKAGYGLQDEQIHQVRQMLSPDEMQLVKDLIDIWKLTKKHLFDAHMTLTGRPLKEVEGVYFRLRFDPELSDTIAEKQAEQQAAEFFKDFFPRVNVQAGAAHERTGGSKAPLLQFGWIPGDLEETAHYGTHAVVVRDILKILKHPSVKNAIKQTYGEMYHHQLMQWLKRVANPNPPESPMKTDRMLNTIRKAQVTYVMFWRLSTALQQPLALMNTAGEVGVIPTLKAIGQFMNPVKLKYYWNFINEKDQNMAQRSLSYDREIFETFKYFDPTHVDWYEQSVAVGQILTAFTDGVVARIGWLAAYNQAMAGEVKNISALDEEMAIRHASSVVIRTQASGSPKDRSSLMASNSASRKMFLTFFFSFLNNQYGFFRQHVSKFMNPNVEYGWLDFLKVVFLTWILQSMAQEIISKGPNVKRNDILTAPLKFPLSTLPGVRDMTSVVLDGYDYRGGLAGNLLNEMKRFMQTMIKPFGAHKKEKRILASLRLVGRLTGLPPDQAFIIAENLVNRRATSPWALIYRQRKGQKP